MSYREMFPELRPTWISYNQVGIVIENPHVIDGIRFFQAANPRLEFLKALKEFDGEEVNTFDTLASGTRIHVDTVLGDNIKIGWNSTIGNCGFGFEQDEDKNLVRMPHFGNVVIEDDCFIGDLVNIHRAVLGSTVIGKGTKIDTQTHVAHNVIIGKRCAIIGAGIGGSAIIGDECYIGFRSVVKQKIKIGNRANIGMGAIILKDVPDDYPDWIYGVWNGIKNAPNQ